MNLQEELGALNQELGGQMPPSAQKLIGGIIAGLQKANISKKGPQVGDSVRDFALDNLYHQAGPGRHLGDKIKDFSLPNPWGEQIRLSDMLKEGPVVLNFYRGNWCPFCNVELRALEQASPRFREFGANLVAISLEKPDESLRTIERFNLRFIVLSDIGGRVARQFKIIFQAPQYARLMKDMLGVEIAEHNGADVAQLVIPATYVIDSDFTVRYDFAEEDFRRRADIDEIIETLRGIQSKAGAGAVAAV